MSEILRRLNQRDAQVDAEVRDTFVERRNFCVQELPRIAHDALNVMVETDFKSVDIGHEEMRFRDGSHAAWKLTSWPVSDIPHEVEKYEVYLLDTADLLSITTFWSGGRNVERYDPYRYELPGLNAISIYNILADLPGVASFKKENHERLP